MLKALGFISIAAAVLVFAPALFVAAIFIAPVIVVALLLYAWLDGAPSRI